MSEATYPPRVVSRDELAGKVFERMAKVTIEGVPHVALFFRDGSEIQVWYEGGELKIGANVKYAN